MRSALGARSPASDSRIAISTARRSTAPSPVAQRTAGSTAPAPPLTTTATGSGRGCAVAASSSSSCGRWLSATTRGPTRSPYGAARCASWSRTAWSSGALPGGKTAASSTRAVRNSGTVEAGILGPYGSRSVVATALHRLAEPPAAPQVLGLLGLGLLDVAGVPRRELDGALRGDAGLQLPAALELGVQLRTEEQREVGDPQPEQEHHDTGESAVGPVV